jgi:predicted membrane GTPase involved in stress response
MIRALRLRSTPTRAPRAFAPLLHPEFPIEQMAKCEDEKRRSELVLDAVRNAAGLDEARCIADYKGLRILGRTEAALRTAVATLAERGHALVVEPPFVRYVYGARVLEPWMNVIVNAPAGFATRVQRDFGRRRGVVRRLSRNVVNFVLNGEAPLADLLAYEDSLRNVTGDGAYVAMSLSRYLPIDHGPLAA